MENLSKNVTRSVRKNAAFSVMFPGGILSGKKIRLVTSISSGMAYALYKLTDEAGGTDVLVQRNLTGYTWDYIVPEGETVYGFRIWVSEGTEEGVFTYAYDVEAVHNTYVISVNGLKGYKPYPELPFTILVLDASDFPVNGTSGDMIPQRFQEICETMRPFLIERTEIDNDYQTKLEQGIPYQPIA